MNLVWIMLGIMGVFRIGTALSAHYAYDHYSVTIIGNCLIPVLALFLVGLLNEIHRLLLSISTVDEDE